MIRIKIPIKEEGLADTYLCSNSKMEHDGYSNIVIHYWQQTEQPGVPTEPGPLRAMTVDDTTRLPAVNPDGTPITHLMRVLTGYAQVTTGSGETYTDYSQPIYEQQVQQRTLGEYSAVMWWHFDARNPNHQPSIEEMIHEGILRKIRASQSPYHFVVTPEFSAAFGDNW